MSSNLVIDCSFLMSSILPDEESLSIIDIREYNISVPSIFYLECLNVLNSALKRKRISDFDFKEYINLLSSFPCHIDKFSSSSSSVYSISKLSNQFNITSYDASYLELALRLNAKMATYDNKLITICHNAGIIVIN